MKESHLIKNLSELSIFSKSLFEYLSNNECEKARTIALSGDLGAGKTTLVQLLAKELSISEMVTSPTFTIMKIYPIDNHPLFKRLVHIDAYRIDEIDELRPLRLEDILVDKTNLVCIEWAERIASVLPTNTIKITIKNNPSEEREISVFNI